MATGDAGGGVALWDAALGTRLAAFSRHAADVLALAASPDGTALFAAGVDPQARPWGPWTRRRARKARPWGPWTRRRARKARAEGPWTRRRARAAPCAPPSFSGLRRGVCCGRQRHDLAATAKAGIATGVAPALAGSPGPSPGGRAIFWPRSDSTGTCQTVSGLQAARVGS